jgi:hypothetical protein
MASSTTKSQPAPKQNGNGKSKSGSSGSKAKATPKRPQYDERVKTIAEKARGLACPETRQGPVSKQVADVMRVLKDPCEALKEAGLTQKQVKEIATGNGDAESKKKLRPLGERVVEAGGAKQWVRGRSLAATLAAWIEEK